MHFLSLAMAWFYNVVATWYAAAILGGVLILLAERLSHRKEPSDSDVCRAAERYRRWYGTKALIVIGDHMLAASFAPDSRHKRFLKRVSDELHRTTVSSRDRLRAIDL